MKNKKIHAVLTAAGLAFVTFPSFALDTVATIASITGAQTDIEAVAIAIIGVAAVLFGISKIRQVIKA